MQDKNSHQLLSPKLIIAIASTVLALGSATAWIAYSSLSNKTTQGNNPRQVITKNPEQNNNSTNNQEKQQIEVYWLNDNLEIVSQTLEVDKAENKEKYLITALNQLLDGPSTSAEGTAIPKNTKLNKLTVADDGIHLDLSADFTTGGGSASMIGRLGQIIYTATSLDKNAPVWISVEGQPLELLGGEGLMVEQPMTRELFNQNF